MPDPDKPDPGIGAMGAQKTRGGDGISGDPVAAGLEVDGHDLSAVSRFDPGANVLAELPAATR